MKIKDYDNEDYLDNLENQEYKKKYRNKKTKKSYVFCEKKIEEIKKDIQEG